MKNWVIMVPGWGTVYGIGTYEEALEVVELRKKSRGQPTIQAVNPDEYPLTAWTTLAPLLKEMRQ